MEHENKAIDHMDIDQSTHSISGLPVSIFHIQQQYQKHWNIIFLHYWWIFPLLYELQVYRVGPNRDLERPRCSDALGVDQGSLFQHLLMATLMHHQKLIIIKRTIKVAQIH